MLASGLAQFPFPTQMLVCQNKGIFPDLILRLNSDRSLFTGGELIELKESKSCSIASFNSTIPTGEKAISELLNYAPSIGEAMRKLGEQPNELPTRQVFYLLKGFCEGRLRVCLVHGRYFQTLEIAALIREAFHQVIADMIEPSQIQPELPVNLQFRQTDFSQTRHIEGAAVSLRFRIMTQVEPAANILRQVADNSLNFILPSANFYTDEQHDLRLRTADCVLFEQLQRLQHTHRVDGSRYRLYSITL